MVIPLENETIENGGFGDIPKPPFNQVNLLLEYASTAMDQN